MDLSVLFLPIARSTAAFPYYQQIQGFQLDDDVTSVVAMDLGEYSFIFSILLG